MCDTVVKAYGSTRNLLISSLFLAGGKKASEHQMG